MWNKYDNYRTVITLKEVVQLRLKIRRCPNPICERFHQAYRPEQESRWALPQHEFGLDVIALVGAVRYQEHRSVSQIHEFLQQRGLGISQRSVSHLIDRYDELVATCLSDNQRLQNILQQQQRVILAIDGMQPDVGHEVLWVIRECISGEILLAKTSLSATQFDLSELIKEVKSAFVGANCGGRQRWTTLYSQCSRNGIARSRTWLVSFPLSQGSGETDL